MTIIDLTDEKFNEIIDSDDVKQICEISYAHGCADSGEMLDTQDIECPECSASIINHVKEM